MSSLVDKELRLKSDRQRVIKIIDELMKGNRAENKAILNEKFAEVTLLDDQILELEKQNKLAAQRANKVFEGKYFGDDRISDGSTIFADCLRSIKHGSAAKDVPDSIRALTTAGSSAIIQDPLIIDEVIHSLMSNNDLAEAGVDIQQVDQNYQNFPKVTAPPAHEWQASEGDQLTIDSALTIGSVALELKTVACRVSVSQQVLLDSRDRARRIIQEEIRRQLQGAIAQAVFTGTGASGQPLGVEGFSGLQTVDASGTALSDWAEIIDACRKLAAVNCQINRIGAFFSPTGWSQLASFSDTTGQPLRTPSLLEPVRFFNPTTHVLETYDTNTTTRMFLGDFSKLKVHIQGPISIVTEHLRADRLMVDFIVFMRMDVKALFENHFCIIDNISLS